MPALGYQRTQDAHQLAGIHVVYRQHLGDVFIAGGIVAKNRHFVFLGLHFRHDTHQPVTAAHGGKALGLEHAEEDVVQLVAPNRLPGDHVDLATHTRVNNKVDTGFLADDLDQAIDVRITQIEDQIFPVCRCPCGLSRQRTAQRPQTQCQRQRQPLLPKLHRHLYQSIVIVIFIGSPSRSSDSVTELASVNSRRMSR